jgi:hypothetical protein
VAAVAALAVGFGGLGPTRSEGQPAAPPSDAAVIVQDRQAALSAVYAGTEAAVDRAGLVRGGRIHWSVYGPVPLYGPIPVLQEGAGEVKEWISVPGFPEEGYQADMASGTVDLGQGVLLQVSSSQVEGGLPLAADYCAWFDALSSATGSARAPGTECRQATTDDGGLLITSGDDRSATYVWSGGQVEVNLMSLSEGGDPVDVSRETMVAIATDPAVRWRQQ